MSLSIMYADATEVGLYNFIQLTMIRYFDGIDIEEYRHDNQVLFEIPFNSTTKFQLTIHNIGM